MRFPFLSKATFRLLIPLVVVGSAALLSESDTPVFTANDRLYYADQNQLAVLRPGLEVSIRSASIEADGTIQARIRLTDPMGLPLDREGITTAGPITVRLVAAYIPQGQTKYVAYNTRVQTSPITNVSAIQATSDSNGTFTKVDEGEYIYTFRTKAPANFDRTATHAIGLWANRNMSEFDMNSIRNQASTVFTFVPDGSPVTVTRDVVRTATCNKCHDPLSAHDNRRTVELCVLCHTPQTVDPDTGHTMDMTVMTHKIHAGEELPSVQAGGSYIIIGNQQSEHDYSNVVHPAGLRNCTSCHDQNSGAEQATAFLRPTREACGSCHDNVNFATGENHANLPQNTDNNCARCHRPEGEMQFDLSVTGAHTLPRFARDLPGTNFEIVKVDNGTAGQRPTVTFSIKDKNGDPVPASEMSSLSLILAGPTTDYANYVSETATGANCGGDGLCVYTFRNAVPAESRGSYSISIQGYRNVTLSGVRGDIAVRDAGQNKTVSFSVDGTPVQERRQVVSLDKCNNCHFSLSLHGDNRNQVDNCVLCHNPNVTDSQYRTEAMGPAQTMQFAHMIHKIHTGEAIGEDYIIIGRNGSINNFGHVRYPGDRRNCSACHVNGSENPPTQAGLLPVTDPAGLLNPMGTATAACTGCHTSIPAASHALSNTTEKLGEACAACHASNREFSVTRLHAR